MSGLRQAYGLRGAPRATMLRMKVYRTGREILVAATDEDLVGRTLEEGRLRLEVTAAFYGDEVASETDLLQNLRLCTVANLVGEAAVGVAVAHGFVDADSVLRVEGVPHAQVARFGA